MAVVAVAPLAIACVALPLGDGTLAHVFYLLGWIWGAVTIWLVVSPDSYRQIVLGFLDIFERSGTLGLRVVGVFASAIGVALIHHGISIA